MPKKDSKELAIKLKALQEVAAGGKKGEIAKKYGVPSSTLSTWIKKKEKLESAFETMQPNRRRSRAAKYEDIEKALLSWFIRVRDENVPISGPLLKAKAEDFAGKCIASVFCILKISFFIIYKQLKQFSFLYYIPRKTWPSRFSLQQRMVRSIPAET